MVAEALGPKTTGQHGPPESSGVARQCVWSARYVDAAVLENIWGTRRYLLGDANFNVTSVINTSGEPVEHYQYDPYGRATVLNGGTPDTDGDEWTADPNNSTDVANHWLYTGRWQDYRSLFYYYRNRYYHPGLGRFVSRDPIGYRAGDANMYRLVRNRPSTAVDACGLNDIRIKSGTTNIVHWMPEAWWGLDLPRAAQDLGTVDAAGTVTFLPGFGLASMDLDALKQYGGADTFTELMAALKGSQCEEYRALGGCSYTEAAYLRVRGRWVRTANQYAAWASNGLAESIGSINDQIETVATATGYRGPAYAALPKFAQVAVDDIEGSVAANATSLTVWGMNQLYATLSSVPEWMGFEGPYDNGTGDAYLWVERLRQKLFIRRLDVISDRIKEMRAANPRIHARACSNQ